MENRAAVRWTLVLILVTGLALRLWVAVGLFPAEGFAPDLRVFVRWGDEMLRHGPTAIYAVDRTANYPPIAMGVIWILAVVTRAGAQVLGGDAQHLLAVLLKLPAVLADIASAWLVFRLVHRRAGGRPALVAAGLFLLLPAVWYDSVLWGQLDSLLLLGSLAALSLWIEGRFVAAGVVSVLTMLVKPQGVLVVLIVCVAVVATVVRDGGDGRRRFGRVLLVGGSMAAAFVGCIALFGYRALAPDGLAGLPIVGDIAGFVQQSVGTASLFPVLTANAFDLWALTGHPPLAVSMSAGGGWRSDALPIAFATAASIGLLLLAVAIVVALVAVALRPDRTTVLLAFAAGSFALFDLPTRSHERYLVPVFGVLAVLAAGSLLRWLCTFGIAIVSAINMHAVLAASASGSRSRAGTPIGLPGAEVAQAPTVIVLCALLVTGATMGILVLLVAHVRRRAPAGA